jgi:hypothetical protein
LKIFLRIPTAHGVDREMTRWLVWAARAMPDADIDIHCSCWGVVENRNEICRQFLESDCTHLWMLDSDTVVPRTQRKWPKEKVFPVDACGTGCMILDREILEAVSSTSWFEKTHQGEDFNFCNRIIDMGFEVMVNSHYRCDHQKDVSLKLLSRITKGI